jgi:hypothetical protein
VENPERGVAQMIEQFIAVVPASIWQEGRPAGAKSWESSFNVAAWIRLSGTAGKVALMVRHSDDTGVHRTPVDSAVANQEGSSLMSSQIRLRFSGKVKEVAVVLQLDNPDTRYQVEELYMQLQESHQQQRKLIASF